MQSARRPTGGEAIEKRTDGSRPVPGVVIRWSGAPQLHALVLLVYALFLAAFFLVPNAVDVYKFYSMAVFAPGLLYCVRTVRLTANSRLALATLLCLGYMLTTSFWSREFSAVALWHDTQLLVYIAVFLLVTVTMGLDKGEHLDRVLRLVCVCAAVSAVISVPYWYSHHPFPVSRLVSIGMFTSPNQSSFVYGFFSLLSVYYVVQSNGHAERVLYLAVVVTLLAFVTLTQSRTGILATLFSALLLVVFSARNKKTAFGIAVLIGLVFAAFELTAPDTLSRLNNLEITHRIDIWQQALAIFSASPVFGQGYQSGFAATIPDSPHVFISAHNTFVAALRDGGVVGLGLELYMLLVAIRLGLAELANRGNSLYLVLLLFSLICMSTATDRLITRPRELWILLWLPLALLVIRELQQARGASPSKGVC